MAEIVFSTARNGQKTCSVNNILIHSCYNPQKEAERFVENIIPDFSPSSIIVIEPALSYCASFLREKFPSLKLGAVRFSKVFHACDKEWDFVVQAEQLYTLLECLGEETLLESYFVTWPPAQKAFSIEYESLWMEIHKLLTTSRDILATRSYYGVRWIKNAMKFCVATEKTAIIKRGNSPILLAASGPSLIHSIPHIKKHRNLFFLIAVSSAYEPLRAANIFPDLCISTDGGYWAKRHLAYCSSVLAVSAESSVPTKLLSTLPVIPLRYGDAPEANLIDICGFTTMEGKRNGTVSGTAAELALNLTTGPVIACGLDLMTWKGFPHTQPNMLESDQAKRDFRVSPKETRLYPQQQANASLEIYRQWFSNRGPSFYRRFFRISTENNATTLGCIQDKNWVELDYLLAEMCNNADSTIKPQYISATPLPSKAERLQRIKNLLSGFKLNGLPDTWISALLPADNVLYNRSKDKTSASKRIQEKETELIDNLEKYVKRLEFLI